jgi:hypothetical protein
MISTLLVLTLLTAQADANAGAKTAASALVNEGNRLFEAGKFSDALEKYESAHHEYPSAKILFNIAEAHNALEHASDAATYYDRFLIEANVDPTSELAAKVREKRRALEPKLAYLDIRGEPAGAEIAIDGSATGTLPLKAQHVAPGKHQVTAKLTGYERQEGTVDVEAGQRAEISVKLVPAAPAPRTDLVAATTAPSGERELTSEWWFWAAIAGAAVAGVAVTVAVASGGDYTPEAELGYSSTKTWTAN